MIDIKLVYEPIQKEDGFRVLVDRMWPRGVPKEKLRADLWLKYAAPSTALRKWFGHQRAKWEVKIRTLHLKEIHLLNLVILVCRCP
jgi:uncharacterized protein YeaO (DUF488 family)